MSEIAAYHEAGHIVVAAELGGRIVSASIDVEADDSGPILDGDVVVEWPGGRSARVDVLVALAGPVAEMIYVDGDPDPNVVAAWSGDYQQALSAVSALSRAKNEQQRYLRVAVNDLESMLRRDDIWAVVGDVADSLLAHEYLDAEMVSEILAPWGY